MEIVSYGADDKHNLWAIVSSESPIVLGESDVFKIDKIELEHANITKHDEENQYKIYFAALTVGEETYLSVQKAGDVFRAHFISDHFKDARVQPSDFIKTLIEEIKGSEHTSAVKYFASETALKIEITQQPNNNVAVYENLITDAYLDYLLFGKIRAHYVTFVTEGNVRGSYGTNEIQDYTEKLNQKLRQAADAIQVDFSYAYYNGETFRIVAGMKNGRAVEIAVPMGILIYLADCERELSWDLSRNEEAFSLAIDWEAQGLPEAYLTAWQHPDWNALQHIGQVK